MKSKLRLLLLLPVAAFLIAGCVVRSIHPLYKKKDVLFEPALVGNWAKPDATSDDKERWDFSKAEDGSYLLDHKDDKGRKALFSVHLLKLDSTLYADFFVTEPWSDDREPNEAVTIHLLPVHTFARVERKGQNWIFHWLDEKWLSKELEKNPKLLSHYRPDDKDNPVVLTATTPELQAFVRKHGEDAFAGDAKTELARKK